MLPDLATLDANRGVARALQYALAIFSLTVLIGLANATKVFGPLSRDTILAHVHSGTLGFITMAVFGITLWVFGGGASSTSQRSVHVTAAAILAYVVAFWSGNLPARAIFGTILLAVIVGWWIFVFLRVRSAGFGSLDIPRLSIFLGLTTLVVGSTLGVVVQVVLATGNTLSSNDIIGAHATAQVAGYLVLTAVGIGEWRLRADRGARRRGGLLVAYLLFVAGLLTAFGILLGIIPLALIANLLQLAAVGAFVASTAGALRTTAWSRASGERHVALVGPFLVLNVILFFVTISLFLQAQGDFTKVPMGVVTAYDHSMFVAVMTNAIFGIAMAVAPSGGSSDAVDNLVFWLLNLGVVAFLAVLVFGGYDSALVRFTAPVMGAGVLLGIISLSLRLNRLVAAPGLAGEALSS